MALPPLPKSRTLPPARSDAATASTAASSAFGLRRTRSCAVAAATSTESTNAAALARSTSVFSQPRVPIPLDVRAELFLAYFERLVRLRRLSDLDRIVLAQ